MAYVGVSAQKVGVEGGGGMGGGGMPLKKVNPARYGTLVHPGDNYAFDIFSQAGAAVKHGGVLGPLKPRHVLATGESQSAVFMTTYVDAIDPIAKVYDGFYIHSRFGGAPRPETASMRGGANTPATQGVKMRPNLRVPVMTLISETDLLGTGLSGFWAAQQPDNDKLRIWEMPGTSHVDNYMFFVGGHDDGNTPPAKLAEYWKPTDALFGAKMAKPINSAPQHHYVAVPPSPPSTAGSRPATRRRRPRDWSSMHRIRRASRRRWRWTGRAMRGAVSARPGSMRRPPSSPASATKAGLTASWWDPPSRSMRRRWPSSIRVARRSI